jgi:hypothetical protein
LKSFAPVEKSSGAFGIIEGAFGHKKTLRTVWLEGSAPLQNAEFLRNLTSSAALVNTPITGASK